MIWLASYVFRNIQDSMRAALALSDSTKYSLKTIDQEELSAVFTHHASCSFPDNCFEYVEQEWHVILVRAAVRTYCMCKEHTPKGRQIAKYWWDTERAIQAMMESRIKRHVQNEHHISRLLPLVYCIHIPQLYWAFSPTVCHWFKYTAFLLS